MKLTWYSHNDSHEEINIQIFLFYSVDYMFEDSFTYMSSVKIASMPYGMQVVQGQA